MASKKGWLFAMLAGILVLSLLPGCVSEKATPAETEAPTATPTPSKPPPLPTPLPEISLDEAEELMGVPLLPEYFPAGYELQRCVVFFRDPPAYVALCFSDEAVTEKAETAQTSGSFTCKIVLDVRQIRKMPPPNFPEGTVERYGGKVVDINGTKGRLATGPLGCGLSWFQPGLLLHLYTLYPKEIPEEEILRIAESIK